MFPIETVRTSFVVPYYRGLFSGTDILELSTGTEIGADVFDLSLVQNV